MLDQDWPDMLLAYQLQIQILKQLILYLNKFMISKTQYKSNKLIINLHALKNLTFQFTPVTHMVYLEIRLHYLNFAIEKLTSSNWISKYTMCVTGVN